MAATSTSSRASRRVANNGIKLIDNAFFRDRMLKSLYKKEQGPQHKVK